MLMFLNCFQHDYFCHAQTTPEKINHWTSIGQKDRVGRKIGLPLNMLPQWVPRDRLANWEELQPE